MTPNHRSQFTYLPLVVGLVCIAIRHATSFIIGYSLKFPGETAPLFWLFGSLVIFITPFLVWFYALIRLFMALIKKTSSPISPALTIGLITAAIWLPDLFPLTAYNAGLIQKIKTAGEPAYLSLAQDIRKQLSSEASEYPVTTWDAVAETDPNQRDKKIEYLDKLLPANNPAAAQWPKWLLDIIVEQGNVRISRGSGMLGTIGVVILDQSKELQQYSPGKLSKNSYLPCYVKITDRLYMFTSD